MTTKRKLRGVVLISVLFIMIFLVFFAVAMLGLTISQQRQASAYFKNRASFVAAQAGIQYAMSRLESNPTWRGCSTSNNLGSQGTISVQNTMQNTTSSNLPGISRVAVKGGGEVYEHYVNGNAGCVEGKIPMGAYDGYFVMYFQKPASDDSMVFFKKTGPAGSMDANPQLCANNFNITGATAAKYSDGTVVAGRVLPPTSIYIVCKGVVGNETKTVETCFRLGVDDDSNSVIIGRNALSINFFGQDEDNQKICLLGGTGGKPSMLRSVGSMSIGLDSDSSAKYPKRDYLYSENKSGGVSQSSNPNFNPAPSSGGNRFSKESDQERFIPKLKITDVLPASTEYKFSFKAGSYLIYPREPSDPLYYKSPLVRYYDTDSYSDVATRLGTFKDVSSDFKANIEGGKLKWNPLECKLTVLQSCSITTGIGSSGGTLSNFNIVSPKTSMNLSGGRVTLQVGPNPQCGTEQPMVYLVNNLNNGGMFINGQLSGIGTVITRGNLDLQAESQIYSNPQNGISIYSGGDVTLHELDQDPVIPGTAYAYSPSGSSVNNSGVSVNNSSNNGNSNSISSSNVIVNTGSGGNNNVSINISNSGNGNIDATVDGNNVYSGSGNNFNYYNGIATVDGNTVNGTNNAATSAYKKIKQKYTEDPNGSTYLFQKSDFTAQEQQALQNCGFNFTGGSDNQTYLGVNLSGSQPVDLNNVRCYPFRNWVDPGNGVDNGNGQNFELKLYGGHDPDLAQYTNPSGTPTPSASSSPGINTMDNSASTSVPTGFYDFKGRPIDRRDSVFYGLIYCCRDFKAASPKHSFILVGGLVAFGGSTDGVPGSNGNITLETNDCQLRYDSRYLSKMLVLGGAKNIQILYWAMN